MLVFPRWKLGDVDYQTVRVFVPSGTSKITVNGVEVPVAPLAKSAMDEGSDVATLPVLPGTYEFSAPPLSEDVDAAPVTLVVNADGSQGDDEGLAMISYSLNDKGRKKVQDDVNATIDQCAGTGSPSPDGCPFGVYAGVESGTWKVDTYPTVEVQDDGEGGYYLATTDPGHATFSYQETYFGTTTPQSTDTSISVSGEVTLDDKGEPEVELNQY